MTLMFMICSITAREQSIRKLAHAEPNLKRWRLRSTKNDPRSPPASPEIRCRANIGAVLIDTGTDSRRAAYPIQKQRLSARNLAELPWHVQRLVDCLR